MRTGLSIRGVLLVVALCAIVAVPALAGSPYGEDSTISVQQTPGSNGRLEIGDATANFNVPTELDPTPRTTLSPTPQQRLEYEPVLGRMIAQIDESKIYHSISDLQNLATRMYPSPGNRQAASYLYERLVAIPDLEVEYQSDRYQTVIASLPGKDNSSDKVVIVGAHYDSKSTDPDRAPGATDNGCGVAIVLELARVMSRYQFNQTIQFAFWNAEEERIKGSTDYVMNASEYSMDIPLYFNFDCACYDPDDQYLIDVIFNGTAEPVARFVPQYNSLYGTDFDLTFNVQNDGISDHVSFWEGGYPAIMTATHTFPPETHTQNDTIELMSPGFARKNAQLGTLVLANTAGYRTEYRTPRFGLNGETDITDIVLLFNRMTRAAASEQITTSDDRSNSRPAVADVIWLFNHL